jgi:hypothetical protein
LERGINNESSVTMTVLTNKKYLALIHKGKKNCEKNGRLDMDLEFLKEFCREMLHVQHFSVSCHDHYLVLLKYFYGVLLSYVNCS